MQQAVCERVIPRIVYTRASICDDDFDKDALNACLNTTTNNINNNNNNNIVGCEVKSRLQKKTPRCATAARLCAASRSSRRASLEQYTLHNGNQVAGRRSTSSSRSPSPQYRLEQQQHQARRRRIASNCEGVVATGYKQYLELLEVPALNGLEWSEPSADELSSEWDSDHSCRSDPEQELRERNDRERNVDTRPKVEMV